MGRFLNVDHQCYWYVSWSLKAPSGVGSTLHRTNHLCCYTIATLSCVVPLPVLLTDYDGGDCCECTCVDTLEYRCGSEHHGGYACLDPRAPCVDDDDVTTLPESENFSYSGRPSSLCFEGGIADGDCDPSNNNEECGTIHFIDHASLFVFRADSAWIISFCCRYDTSFWASLFEANFRGGLRRGTLPLDGLPQLSINVKCS